MDLCPFPAPGVLQVTYVEVADVFAVEGLQHTQLPGDGVDGEDAGGRLVSSGAGHTVAQVHLVIVV